MERYLEELRKFDEIEHVFGNDLIDRIQWEEREDTYLVNIEDNESVVLNKNNDFEENYEKMVAYLTNMKSQILNHMIKGDSYYHDWLIFRVHYVMQKAHFYLKISDLHDSKEIIQYLSDSMGKVNYKTVVKLINLSLVEYRRCINTIFNYLGATRALRDLALTYLDDNEFHGEYWALQLWNLTPTFLTDQYGYIFYIGNEMGKMDNCPYDYKPEEYYYLSLYQRYIDNIMDNQQLTIQQKEEIVHKIQEEINK